MRIDVHKFLFIGPANSRDAFLKRAQKAGLIEFTGGLAQKSEGQVASAKEIEALVAALKILKGAPPLVDLSDAEHDLSGAEHDLSSAEHDLSSAEQGDTAPFDAEKGSKAGEIAGQVLQWQKEIKDLDAQISAVHEARQLAAPFGPFSLNDLRQTAKRGNRVVQFFTRSLAHLPAELPAELIEVNRSGGRWFGLSLATSLQVIQGFSEIELERSASEWAARACELEQMKLTAQRCITDAANATLVLERALIYLINERARRSAGAQIAPLLGDKLFAAAGWVAASARPQLSTVLGNLISAYPVKPESCEIVPTQLANKGAARIGQDLTEVYDIPSSADSDPSGWVLWSFVCFFALIIGDGGYGILFLLGTWWASRKVGAHTSFAVTRMLRLARLLSCACIIWGVLSASFFALPLAPTSPFRRLSLTTKLAEAKARYHFAQQDQIYKEWTRRIPELAPLRQGKEILQRAYVTDGGSVKFKMLSQFADQISLELSLIIGIAHICLSLGRYAKRNWSQLGWILFLAGAYAYVPRIFGAATLVQVIGGIPVELAHFVGSYLLVGGFALALVLAFAQRGIWGILEATTLIQIGADVLSYLRIYALGLSGAILSNTINEGAAATSWPLAVVILISGHGVNLVLGLMGGVIHGLRLNFLEWYHYSFEGAGDCSNP